MSASIPTSNGKKLVPPLSNSLDLKNKIEQIQKQIKYTFKNPSLLHRALTRQNAIQEQHPNAYEQNFEALEFVGDAALKHGIARLLYSKHDGKASESQLHEETAKLVANEGVMPQIARHLKLDQFVIKGKGELLMTSNILTDSLEALLGAISIDCGDNQEQLWNVIKYLWQSYLDEKQVVSAASSVSLSSTLPVSTIFAFATVKPTATIVSSLASSQVTNTHKPKPNCVPSEYQPIFCGLSSNTSIELFRTLLTKITDVDRRNIGKKGNTALMMLLSRRKLRNQHELPKIKALLEKGASWEATNNKDESAEDFASLKHGGKEAVLRMIDEP